MDKSDYVQYVIHVKKYKIRIKFNMNEEPLFWDSLVYNDSNMDWNDPRIDIALIRPSKKSGVTAD